MPVASPLHVALISVHTNPYGDAGSGDVGGMNIVIRHTASQLARLGHHVEVITRRTDRAQDAVHVLPDGVRLRVVDAGPAAPLSKGEHLAYIPEFIAALERLGSFDVLHAHHWYSGLAALPVAQARRIPLVQSFHSVAADPDTALAAGERPEIPERLAAERAMAQAADAVITVSQAEARTVIDRLGADPQRVHVVHPGVDSVMFSPQSSPAGGLQGSYIAAAARIERLKGLDLAIAALARIRPDARPDFIIAGGPSSQDIGCLEELREQAQLLGVADRVRFVGALPRPDLARLLAGARLVIVPSHSETYGLVALEASACGIPVVAQATGGLEEAIVDGESGILLHDRDPEQWARALTRLLDDQALATHLSAGGRRLAVERGWEHTAQGVLAVYRELNRMPV